MYKFLFYKQVNHRLILKKKIYSLPNIYIYLKFIKIKHYLVESSVTMFNSFINHSKLNFMFQCLMLTNLNIFYGNSFLIHLKKEKYLTFRLLTIFFEKKFENLCIYTLLCFPMFLNFFDTNILEFLTNFFFFLDKWLFLFFNKNFYL